MQRRALISCYSKIRLILIASNVYFPYFSITFSVNYNPFRSCRDSTRGIGNADFPGTDRALSAIQCKYLKKGLRHLPISPCMRLNTRRYQYSLWTDTCLPPARVSIIVNISGCTSALQGRWICISLAWNSRKAKSRTVLYAWKAQELWTSNYDRYFKNLNQHHHYWAPYSSRMVV